MKEGPFVDDKDPFSRFGFFKISTSLQCTTFTLSILKFNWDSAPQR
jgi:hypothetical protein